MKFKNKNNDKEKMDESINEMKFGKPLRDKFYRLDQRLALTNHGSYGSAPSPVLEKKRQLQDEMESSPDMWFRYRMFDLWSNSLSALASYLKVDVNSLLIGENATENINAVLKSIPLDAKQDAILTTNFNYGAILNSIDYTARYRLDPANPVYIHEIQLKLAISKKEELVEYFDKACEQIINQKKLRIRLAVIDHISSATAILYPVAEICQTIRKWSKDCVILIDGAHCVGQVELNFNAIGCDFYVSNLHKWLFAPRSCSFIYTSDPKNFQDQRFQPCYISWNYNKPASENFFQRGTADKTSSYVVDECARFSNSLGGFKEIAEYSSSLANNGRVMLEKAWKAERLPIGNDLEAPFMKVIKLPLLKEYVIGPEPADVVCSKLIRRLIDEFQVIACVVAIENQLYVRISAFVYNSIDDYKRLGDAILILSKNNLYNN